MNVKNKCNKISTLITFSIFDIYCYLCFWGYLHRLLSVWWGDCRMLSYCAVLLTLHLPITLLGWNVPSGNDSIVVLAHATQQPHPTHPGLEHRLTTVYQHTMQMLDGNELSTVSGAMGQRTPVSTVEELLMPNVRKWFSDTGIPFFLK